MVGRVRLLHHLERPLLQRTQTTNGHGISERVADNHYFFDPENPADARTNLKGAYPRLTFGTPGDNRQASEFYEYKGDYLKLKNVQIGYTLPLPDHEEILRPAAAVLRIGREPAHHHRLPGPRPGERLRHRLSPHAFGHIRSTDNILTTMKKLYYTILATAAALTTASCVDLLNTAPENQIASENMWTTPELALKGMNGLYETFYNRKQSNGTQVRSENLDGLNKYGIEALGFCTDYYANNYPIYLLYNQAKRANDWQLAHEWRFLLHDRARRQRRRHEPAQRPDWTPRPTSVTSARPGSSGPGPTPLEQILAGRPGLPRAHLQRAVHADAGERRIRGAKWYCPT